MIKPFKFILLIIIVNTFLGIHLINCGNPKQTKKKNNNKKVQITVSILPQKYFVQQIIKDTEKFNIQVMIPPGHNPATYAPTPQQMHKLRQSSLYLRIGYIPFEMTWMKKLAINNPHMKIVDTSEGVSLIESEEKIQQNHRHHNHHHGGIDPHIWLSPKEVKIQLKHILNAIIKLDQTNKAKYTENHQRFTKDIIELDSEIMGLFERLSLKKFLVFHPAWSYFARDYDLEQLAVEVEGKKPNPSDLKKLIDLALREKLRVIFVQKQFDTNSAEAIATEIKGQVVQIDPLAENWMENMKKIAQTFAKELTPSNHSKAHWQGNQ